MSFQQTSMPTVQLACGHVVPALGQGTWFIGDNPETHDQEALALRAGMDHGMTLIDTAEMYGYGRSELLIGDALDAQNVHGGTLRDKDGKILDRVDREDVYLVSKVLPNNAEDPYIHESLDASLEALGVDYLDLYLLHWKGSTPLRETVMCLESMVEEGKIRAWGVSNFDTDDMEDLWRIPEGRNCQVNQVLYHPGSRGIEYDLLPWMEDHDVTLMAYCPLAQAGTLRRGLFSSPVLQDIARKHHATVAQVILAWDIRNGSTIAIPRSSSPLHTVENAGAALIKLDDDDLYAIDNSWPAPRHKTPLDIQ